MKLGKLAFFNFRNLENTILEFEEGFNLFYGKNGQGKTSLIEAIYFAISGKSFRTKFIKELKTYDCLSMSSYLEYQDQYSKYKNLAVKLEVNKKKYLYNKTKVSYDEFIGQANVISFIPEDVLLITSAPSMRRSFFDYEISQASYEYYSKLKEYDKILKTRNKLLKQKATKGDIFDIYNEKFLDLAAELTVKRIDYVKKISILLNLNYRKLFDSKSELKLKYNSMLGDVEKFTLEEIKELYKKKYKEVFSKEKHYSYTLLGPQKDDFVFLLRDKEARAFSSQGEKKSIIFSLKVSEIDMIIKEKGEYPIFLMDDISSYFDNLRENSIINYLENRKVQVFITSTEKLNIKSKFFYVEEGVVSEKFSENG